LKNQFGARRVIVMTTNWKYSSWRWHSLPQRRSIILKLMIWHYFLF